MKPLVSSGEVGSLGVGRMADAADPTAPNAIAPGKHAAPGNRSNQADSIAPHDAPTRVRCGTVGVPALAATDGSERRRVTRPIPHHPNSANRYSSIGTVKKIDKKRWTWNVSHPVLKCAQT